MKHLLIFIFLTNNVLRAESDHVVNLQLNPDNTTKAPYGAIIGYASSNVEAYSNGNDSYISYEGYFLYGIYMGMKWQCVEYARRWLFMRKGCTFDSVVSAADTWEFKSVYRLVDKQRFKLKKYPNGSPDPPKNESFLIYSREGLDMPYGHIAVIVDVLPGFIRVAEENYDFYYWSGNYSRQIPFVFRNGSYYIEDEYPIIGWMIVEDNNQTKPLDQSVLDAIIKAYWTPSDPARHSKGIYHCLSIASYSLIVFLYISF